MSTGASSLNNRHGMVGWQEFNQSKIDMIERYQSAKIRAANRPVRTEHGITAEAIFREWLVGFLPGRFGVTSGFIIPDLQLAAGNLRHFDVIIFNRLESPVLFTDGNPDKSEQGRYRAIPANHVLAVLEVKAALNPASAKDGIDKLRELNVLASDLPRHFTSHLVFFELRAAHQTKSEWLSCLYAQQVPGYAGGFIFYAESQDLGISGSFKPNEELQHSAPILPAFRKITPLQTDEKGNPQITEQGDVVEAMSLGDQWAWNKAYSPLVPNIDFCWSHNAFANFALDLVRMIEGKAPGTSSSQGRYGFSFLK